MKDTCGSCLHWRLNIQPAAYQGTCMHFLDTTGRHLQMRANDFCSRYIEVEVCHKEPVTCTCDSCITERTKVCGSCKYLTFTLVSKTLFCTNPNSGWEVHGGRTISCNRWEAKDKEPTAATYVLMTLLTRQLAELQAQMKSLDGQFGHHIHDDNRHLRQPEKYKASNSLI